MNYVKIDKCSISNGKGFRVVLWISGCSHNCEDCHNKELWDSHKGELFTKETKEYIYSLIDKDYIDGITFSGGDPLFEGNRKEICNFSKELKEKFPNKTQWLYSGYTLESFKEIVEYESLSKTIDYFVDGKFEKEERDISLAFRGSSNQRIYRFKDEEYVDITEAITEEFYK